MGEYRVQCVERDNGKEYTIRYKAESANAAKMAATGDGWIVGEATDEESAEGGNNAASEGFRAGGVFASVGLAMALCGILLWPLAPVGWVLGACAGERSEGRLGGGARAFGAIVTILSGVIIVGTLFSALQSR